MSDMVILNVGGVYFWTLRKTLAQSSTFFSGLVETDTTADVYFVDRDPTHFRHILNWMRGVRFLPDSDHVLRELSYECEYYAMEDMLEQVFKTPRVSNAKMLKHIADEIRSSSRT